MAIMKFFAEFTDQVFTPTTMAIISFINVDDRHTEVCRIPVSELGDLAGEEEAQDAIVEGLAAKVKELAAEDGLIITGSDSGDEGELSWTVGAMLPITVAAVAHQKTVAAEVEARAILYEAVREQVRQGMPVSHAAACAGITRPTVDRILGKRPVS